MRYLSLIILLVIAACSSENSVNDLEKKVESGVAQKAESKPTQIRNKQWHQQTYPGSDQVKIEGPVDKVGKRHGVWKGYSEQGTLASMTEYKHGVKNGISIVYYPNGGVNYKGEYKNDKPTGIWKVYDRKTGKLINEKDYSKLK